MQSRKSFPQFLELQFVFSQIARWADYSVTRPQARRVTHHLAPAHVVLLIVPIGMSIMRVCVFNIVQHHARYVGNVEALDSALEELATGLPCAYDQDYSVSYAGQEMAVCNRHDGRTIQHEKLVFLPEAGENLPRHPRGEKSQR